MILKKIFVMCVLFVQLQYGNLIHWIQSVWAIWDMLSLSAIKKLLRPLIAFLMLLSHSLILTPNSFLHSLLEHQCIPEQ